MKSLHLLPLIASLVAGQTAAGTGSGNAACADLEKALPAKLVYPNEAEYTSANNAFFDARSIKNPSCIFLPTTANDVATAVKILKNRNQKFAVKSGGHMPGDANSIGAGGVLISTERLNSLTWDGDSVLQVGAGQRWGPVYDKAAEKGRVVIGGRLSQVGVAGLLLGGGISYTAGKYGFSCDNIKGFEIVLANGNVAYASETQNKDLFKALRGGANNFGIVTRFDLDAYSLPLGWAEIGIVDFSVSIPGLAPLRDTWFDAAAEYVVSGAKANPNTGVIAVYTKVPAGNVTIGMTSLWQGSPQPTVEGSDTTVVPDVFKKFVSIPGRHTYANMPLNAVAKAFGELQGGGGEIELGHTAVNTFRTGSYIADKQLILDITKIHDEEFAKISDVTGLTASLTFQPITPNTILAGQAKRGGNVLGLESRTSARGKGFMWTEQFASWTNTADNARVEAAQKKIAQRAKALAQQRKLYDTFVYLNDAQPDEQKNDVFSAYGLKNLAHLYLVKMKYDGGNVFGRLWPGGFKL